jgi:hypothetical protein
VTNLFMFCEPLMGKRHVKVTEQLLELGHRYLNKPCIRSFVLYRKYNLRHFCLHSLDLILLQLSSNQESHHYWI